MTVWGTGWTEAEIDAYLSRFPERRALRHRNEKSDAARNVTDAVTPPLRSHESKTHKLGRGRRMKIDGYSFPSQKEANRYCELKVLQQAGKIMELQVHPWWDVKIIGVQIMRVVADFRYYDRTRVGNRFLATEVVEDVKGERLDKKTGKVKFTTDTRESKIGRRLMLAVHGIEIKVIK